MMAGIDLSALEETTQDVVVQGEGRPLEIRLEDIEEDPNQPRTEFDKDALHELSENIKNNRVVQPVSVRTHPNKKGKWLLNNGARRYRASVIAKKLTIPAYIDDACTDFEQVIDNDFGEPLKPMELAVFIQRKIEEGYKKAEIAKRLGKDASAITQHLSLLDMPDPLEKIYRAGKCRSPKTLYELGKLHKKHPEEINTWCEKSEEVTRGAVQELTNKLKEPTQKVEKKVEQEKKPEITKQDQKLGHDQEKQKSTKSTSTVKNTDQITNPILSISHDKREATLLLNRKPTREGRIFVMFEDGEVKEINAQKCTIISLTES